MSFDYFNQSRSAKGKIILEVILPDKAILSHEAKQTQHKKCMLCIKIHFQVVFGNE